jgi:radical SAM superfamily enzyme YgiQ (UPF0313 family)
MLYPATILKTAGHAVTVMDFPVMGKGRSDFESLAATQDYDAIFFYSVFLSARTDLAARDVFHRGNARTKFVFISSEATAAPEHFINANSVVIRGEPESRVAPLIEAIEKGQPLKGIPGISYMRNGLAMHQGGCQIIDDLDSLPFPDRTLIDARYYHNPKLGAQPFTTLIASRGCSSACYYCVPNSLSFAREIEYKRDHEMKKPPVRFRSAQNVVQEFTALARAGYKAIAFIDDQFLWSVERTLAICEGIAPLGVEWSCLARADSLQKPDVVKAMAGAGCKYVDIGVESFSQEILDYVGKNLKVEMVYTAIANLKAAGVKPKLNILIGSCPLETRQTIEQTFQEVLRLDLDYVLFSVCTPFPYTQFNAVAKKEGWMIKPEYEAIDPIRESFISYPHLTKKELDRTIRRLYRRYYLRPHYIWRMLKQVRSGRELLNKVAAARSLIR